MKLNIKALALACGIIWGLSLLVIAWWLMLLGQTGDGSSLLERVYVGYEFSLVGSFIGLVWGFVDGLIGGAIFAWIYNKLVDSFASE